MIHKSKFNKTLKFLRFIIVASTLLVIACCSSQQPKDKKPLPKNKSEVSRKVFVLLSPTKYQTVRIGESFIIKLKTKRKLTADSLVSLSNSKTEIISTGNLNEFNCFLNSNRAGKHDLKINVHFSDSLKETLLINILQLPSEEPKKASFKLIRSIPHDQDAYTQGLIYKDGVLYESTGQPTRSSIRAIDPSNGEVVKIKALEPQYFGEGIAIVGSEIFMLTYRAQIGFVFDLESFDLIRKFSLQTREGWGLAQVNDSLIMSDGSASLYYFMPDNYFTLIGQTDVCGNNGLINQLNELEHTPYGLFANIYGENDIILIDLKTSIVTHSLDLSELFPKDVPRDMDHVLNGIAYNKKNDSFYVTGKQWPIMYEIKITTN